MSVAVGTCLQCGETREAVKRHGYFCGIMSGGESPELECEFPTHRWADWKDADLARAGIRSEAFARHRRTNLLHLAWVACEDMVRGHTPAKKADTEGEWPFARFVGECLSCGQCTICGHPAGALRSEHPEHPLEVRP